MFPFPLFESKKEWYNGHRVAKETFRVVPCAAPVLIGTKTPQPTA